VVTDIFSPIAYIAKYEHIQSSSPPQVIQYPLGTPNEDAFTDRGEEVHGQYLPVS